MKGCTLRQVPRQTRLRQRALCIALLFAPGTPFASLLAQEPSPDKAAALANIEGACPRDWEAMDAGFMGDSATASDPWRGSIAERDAFIAYLEAELANESLTPDENRAMAADPVAVITECAIQKLEFLRLMASQAGSVIDAGEFTLGVGPNAPEVPDGSTNDLAAESCEFIGAAYPDSEAGYYWIDAGGGTEQQFCPFGIPDGSIRVYAAASCKQIFDHYPDTASGVYWIDVNGAGPEDAFQAWCDMTSDGGGWTLVAAQFEADQLTTWNEGIQADYDPTLVSGRSFTFRDSELPAHSQTAFGKDHDPLFVDYVDYVYTTANIDKTTLLGQRTGYKYHLYRNADNGYRNCNPEEPIRTETWHGSVQFDRTDGRYLSWCYLPHEEQRKRGRGMLGDTSDHDSYAWTVWVR